MKINKIAIALLLLGIYLLSMPGFASALTISSVNTSPSVIAPGEASVLRIEIENEEDKDIEDISIALDLTDVPFAPFDSSSERSIDEIRKNRVKYVEFEIIALNNAKSGIYKIPLKITYKENGEGTKTRSSLIGISVNSRPILSVSAEDSLLLQSQENTMPVRITNKGLSDVRFLEIELRGSTYYSLIGQKNVYIGDLDSDDFDSADFRIFFKPTSLSRVSIPGTLRYKDALNNEYEENFNLGAEVYTKKQAIELGLLAKSPVPTYIGTAIALIAIYLIYRRIKKRRKIKKVDAASQVY